MKKIIFAIAIFAFGFANAQEKTNVGIIPFTNLGGANNQDVIAIQEAVTSSFVKNTEPLTSNKTNIRSYA